MSDQSVKISAPRRANDYLGQKANMTEQLVLLSLDRYLYHNVLQTATLTIRVFLNCAGSHILTNTTSITLQLRVEIKSSKANPR